METRVSPRLGDLVRRHRIAAALSQEGLAERAGLSVRGLSDLERGVHRAPRLETVRMLADALALGDADRSTLLAAARPQVMTFNHQRPEPVPPATLPLPPTRLIGRETEVAALSRLLAPDDVRLVTLTGPGGTGKTHLALTVAAEVHDRFPDGVFFVDLSPLADPALVAPTIAAALHVRENAAALLRETLGRYLRDRRLLLVLDNCEQVLAAASDIAALLATCRNLKILTTSREPLHIRAEREVAVAPLAVPDPERLPPLADLARIPAVALFVERAQAVSATFSITEANAAAIASICRRLDGLPLAIELAAARSKVLPPQALLGRLEQRLPLLTGGGRDLPTRQRTMRDAIAWSYDLLRETEQVVFRRLAVFAGGCTLEAAEAIGGEGGTRDVFASIAALVESSLLRQEDDGAGEPRFRMLETVREYGLEQLALSGETDTVRQRHAGYFLSRLEREELGTPPFIHLQSLARIAREQDNARLALAWFGEREDVDALLRVCMVLYGLWLTYGPYREGVQWFERAIERSGPRPSEHRARALAAASTLAAFQGDYDRATTFIAEGLTLARELGVDILVARALADAGFVSYRRGDYDLAESQVREALRFLSGLADMGPDANRASFVALQTLGDTTLVREQFDQAARWYEASLKESQALGLVWVSIDALAGRAGVHYCTGNVVQAAALYRESLNRARDLGVSLLVASSLFGLAGVAAARGRPEKSARMLGAADGIIAFLGAPMFPRDQPIRQRCVAALTVALDEQRLAAARAAGRALPLDEAIVEAMTIAEEVVPAPN